MYSVMWSEHCSYKSSKIHFKLWGENTTDEMREKLLVGIGENAGVVDIGDGWAVTFKVESHNHPSYVEPYQGAATGVGGIIRDIMSMGARPIAVMDPLRFGNLHHPDTQRVLPGVVAGVGGYGNCIGLPNIGGEVVFDDCYQGNPLVNALCVGAMRVEDIHLAKASGVGNKVILFGARTGGDGIGGVSVLASETFDEGGPTKRPAVQVGDPFAEKVLIECCLDLYKARRRRRHPGPRRRRTLLCHQRARLQRRRRHAGRARPRPAARREPAAAGDPHVGVAGTHDGGRRAEAPRRSSWPSPTSGTSRPPSSARSPTATTSSSPGTARSSSTCRRARSPTRARRTTARWPGRHTSTSSTPTGAAELASARVGRRDPGRSC